ncbi:MAG TPA: hypothetical protein VLY03_07460 [Bacteroidota bacterium]|nr:hypothetical protein [Bacteroidota bacterium]
MGALTERQLHEVFRSIIEGKIVKRIKVDLISEGKNLQPLFIEELERAGYRFLTVREVRVEPGERVPAFYLTDGNAYFGWIFWEQFTTWKLRKLWGSVIRNSRGDWDIQIPVTKDVRIYANESLKLEMDIDIPSDI